MITSIHTWTDDDIDALIRGQIALIIIDALIRGQIALIIRRAEAGHHELAHEAAVHLGEWAARHIPALDVCTVDIEIVNVGAA